MPAFVAGVGFNAATARVAAMGSGPLASELRRVMAEIDAPRRA